MSPNEILQSLRSSKFLVADRSNGYVCPGSMKIVGFDEVLESGCVSFHFYTYDGRTRQYSRFRKGVYLANEDGTFRNVHREIKRLVVSGILETVGNGYPKTLRIKESA